MTRFLLPGHLLCAFGSAALLSVAGRPWGLELLAWVAFVPLLVALPYSKSWLAAAALTGVAALGVTSLGYEPAAALGPGWHTFAVVVAALPFALAGAAAWFVARHGPAAAGPWALALLWVAAEFVPAQPALLGQYALPLSAIGYSQAGLPAMHLARFGSVTATSLALLLANAALAQLVTALIRGLRQRQPRRWLAPTAVLALLAGLIGSAWLSIPPPSNATFDVAVVQPNRPTAVLAAARNVEAVRNQILNELSQLVADSTALGANGAVPDLVVLPEGAWPHHLLSAEPLASVGSHSEATLLKLPPTLVGAPGRDPAGAATNSVFLWTGQTLSHVYAKTHLVPVSEAGLTAGSAPAPVAVPLASGGTLSAAPLICYDVVFPATVRATVRAGAQLLAVLTDGAFAARGHVPYQHLRLARFRAVESGLPLAFASNTGPSALIGGNGALVAVTSRGQATVLRARLGAGVGPTPYVRYGDWVGALTCLVSALLITSAALSAAGKRGGVLFKQP
ncbi:MAG: nitrilase-related carbon-nitrogen hydrolase [Trueperaceae bacterium]